MKLSEALDIQGRLTLQTRTQTDDIIAEVKANNSIVLTGRDLVAKLFIKDIKDTIKPVSQVAVGTGTADVTGNDKTLSQELFRKPINPIDLQRDLQSIDIDTSTGTSTRRRVMITADLEPSEANGALTEAALFTEDNVMYNRVVFKPVNKSPDFKLTLIWEILF